jgi:hypothetical protein
LKFIVFEPDLSGLLVLTKIDKIVLQRQTLSNPATRKQAGAINQGRIKGSLARVWPIDRAEILVYPSRFTGALRRFGFQHMKFDTVEFKGVN